MRDLVVCPGCRRDFVMPVEWEEVDPVLWEVTMRCGNCGRWETGVFDQPTVDLFDDHLDVHTDMIVRFARTLERVNLAAEIERFAAALAVDAIRPEDFA